MMKEDPDDPLQQCPFEQSHRILRSRMAVHIAKCLATSNADLKQYGCCRFDSTHWVKLPKLAEHERTCEKRELVENFLFRPDTFTNPNPSPLSHKTELPPSEENWDDGPAITYDPHLKASSEAVLRTICVEPKSKRKEFRQREAERFQELAQQGKVGMNMSVRVREPQEPAPLRQPRAEVSKLMGLGRGTPHMQEAMPPAVEAVRRAGHSPDGDQVAAHGVADVEQAMAGLQLDRSLPGGGGADAWVTVGRGSYKKKEYPELRKPARLPGAQGYVVSSRDAIAVARGRGRLSTS